MSFLSKLLGTQPDPRDEVRSLWHKTVEIARQPDWYARCGVADTVDGRFDMITAALSVVTVRLEASNLRRESALIAEFFVEDMDGQLREFGVNDVVVGKRVGRLMGVLGGRLGAYRAAIDNRDEARLIAAVARNVSFADAESATAEGAASSQVAAGLLALSDRLAALDDTALLAADFPA